MSELEKALDRSFKGWDDPDNIYHPDVVTVADAARRFASLTSPEGEQRKVLSACLFTIWDRGRVGHSWDEAWTDEFVAVLSEAQ